MPHSLPSDPTLRMGIYKSLSQVPEHHRLKNFESEYKNSDPWEEYLDAYLVPPRDSESKAAQADRSFRHWEGTATRRGRHFALADPDTIETWSKSLLSEYTLGYAATNWSYIQRFYNWLLFHPDHPHRYNPFLFATAKEDAAYQLWKETRPGTTEEKHIE